MSFCLFLGECTPFDDGFLGGSAAEFLLNNGGWWLYKIAGMRVAGLYFGIAQNPFRRFEQHINAVERSPLADWMHEERKAGGEPVMLLCRWQETKEEAERNESEAIAKSLKAGENVLNRSLRIVRPREAEAG